MPRRLQSPDRHPVWTVGHSNRPIADFIALLRSFDIEAIADVRRFPGSRRWPQFGTPALGEALDAHGIAYRWIPALGGRRKGQPDSINVAWRNPSFRAYADYLATEEFAVGLDELAALACGLRTAIMCSEALWWRCHRSLIADVLTVAGFVVFHITAPGRSTPHPMTGPARIVGGRLTYALADATAPEA